MAIERAWEAVPEQPFTANGSTWGLVTIANTAGFRVKQVAAITSESLPPLPVQVKIVISETEMIVGSVDNKIANWPPLNISAYTLDIEAAISAQRQPKNNIMVEDALKAAYEADPVVALRSFGVDQYGNPWSQDNPMPVNADVTVNSVGLFTLPYDSIAATYPSSTQENYQSYLGGLSGTPVQLVVVTYTDATKNSILNVVRTPES